METTQAKIDNVFVKTLNDGRSIYRAIVGDREYTTFKKEIAEAAKQLIDQQAEIGYTVKQNGQWTNYYLESVTPVAQSQNGDGFAQAPPDGKEMRIMREAALHRALLSLPYFTEAERTRETIVTLCDEYLAYFMTGEWGGDSMSAAGPDDDIPF